MKRLTKLLAIGLAGVVVAAFAQGEGAEEGPSAIWKWLNFLILFGLLGYLVKKNAGRFFAARSRKIREDIAQAEELHQDSEARVREVERKLASLESEIAELRAESEREQAAETGRMRQQTEAEMAKIRLHAEQEIASAGKSARLELKRYSAQLAIQLAEQKVRGRITPDTQDKRVRGFVSDLDRPSPMRAK